MHVAKSDEAVRRIYWHTHKLKGSLADCYACSVNYGDRIVFRFVQNPESGEEEIFLLAIGSHDEVY
jgi:mRNA-degrading endonuclease YafQ of YafQ-DinJ toxin-antitoxin module